MSQVSGELLRPDSWEAVTQLVRDAQRVAVRGGGSKSTGTARGGGIVLDLSQWQGVEEYEPSEFTITVRSGTRLSTVIATLAEHRQYLPFDPPLAEAGATIGGTLAANLSGPGRVRYGGARDFVLGVRFVDGRGTLLRGGGKVVKNSAGFDFPKLLVGAWEELGISLQWTLKVFPIPPERRSLVYELDSAEAWRQAVVRLTTRPLDLDAVDYRPGESGRGWLRVRLAGEPEAIRRHVSAIDAAVGGAAAMLPAGSDGDWSELSDGRWCEGKTWIKVPLTPRRLPLWQSEMSRLGCDWRSIGAGQIGWIAWPSDRGLEELEVVLGRLETDGAVIRGEAWRGGQPLQGRRLGRVPGAEMYQRVRRSIDPEGRFGGDRP